MIKQSFLFLVFLMLVMTISPSFGQEDEPLEEFDNIELSESEEAPVQSEENTDTEEDSITEDIEVLDQIEELNKFSDQQGGMKAFIYSERGRKNPFKRPRGVVLEVAVPTAEKKENPISGLEGYDLETFEITAILWDIKYPKALVKSPNDEIFQIEEGTKIGRSSGYVAKIREGEVVVVEATMPDGSAGRKFYKTQVLKLGR